MQGWKKLFVTGQVKLNLSNVQLYVWESDNSTTADILILSVMV